MDRSRTLSTLALLAVLAAMAAWTWERWTEVQVDYGREVYAAWRVADGARLYRDLGWLHGPLSVEWNALLFRVFGVGLRSVQLANLVLVGLGAFLLRGLLARWFGLLAGTAAALVFVVVFALGHHGGPASYNFVAPYSHELPHGALLAVAGFALLQRAEERRSGRASVGVALYVALGAGVLFGCVLLTKAEVAAAALLGLLAHLAVTRRHLGALLLGLALPPACAFLVFALRGGPAAGWEALLAPWRSALAPGLTALPFYRAMAGLDTPLARLAEVARTALGWSLLAALPLVAERLLRGRGPASTRRVAAAAAAAAATVLLANLLFEVDWLRVLSPLPLVLAGWLVVQIVRRRTRGGQELPPATLLSFGVFALALLAKMPLAAWALQYGFVLAMPGTLLVIGLAVGGVPRWLRARGESGVVFRAVALVAVLGFTLGHGRETARRLAEQTVRVGSGSDAFWADPRGRFANTVLHALATRPPGTLVVLPEGALLCYLSRSVNPTPYVQFLPPEFLVFGEERMTTALIAGRPDRLVLWHKDTSEYGLPFLGQDYGRAIGAWANASYETVLLEGDPPLLEGSRYGIALLERRAVGAPR